MTFGFDGKKSNQVVPYVVAILGIVGVMLAHIPGVNVTPEVVGVPNVVKLMILESALPDALVACILISYVVEADNPLNV